MNLCMCKGVTDQQIRQAVAQGARTMGEISARFGVGIECGKCLHDVQQFLEGCLAETVLVSTTSAACVNQRPVLTAMETAPAPIATQESSPRSAASQESPPERAAWFAVDL